VTAVDRAVAHLVPQLGAARVLVDGPEFDDGVRGWNGAVHTRPAVLARCCSPRDVQAALVAARQSGLPLCVRGGGNDWVGRSVCDGALVIDLSGLRTVEVRDGVAVVGGGATASDLLDTAQSHGLSAATGTVGWVGVTGLSTGGGYGRLLGTLGMAADNILAADVVLADGRVVHADAEHEPDLYWALRGAGGNFGVVTALHVRLHPITEITTGMIAFAWAQAEAVLTGVAELTKDTPDELALMFGVFVGPAGPMVYLSPTWSGDAAAAPAVMDRIRALGDPVMDQIAAMPPSASVHMGDDLFPHGRCYAIRTRTLGQLTEQAVAALVEAGEHIPSPLCSFNVHHAHGAAARVDPAATAFGTRGDHLMVEVLPAWETGDGAAELAWAAAAVDALNDQALPGGYANVMGPDDDHRAAWAFGPNAARLLQVKQRYDPDGVFSAIPLPAAPISV
jgi:FAD/FMN-containing dehydrogenase